MDRQEHSVAAFPWMVLAVSSFVMTFMVIDRGMIADAFLCGLIFGISERMVHTYPWES